MRARPEAIYWAWTEGFDSWFAAPGVINMNPHVGEPFFFETHYNDSRHPHYGRFLTLEPNRLIELAWMSGIPGTGGAETVVKVELRPTEDGTDLRLTHAGFYDDAGVQQHEPPWAQILARLDEQL